MNAIVAAGGEAIANTHTVATEAGGKAIIAAALDSYGRIDGLIHNAGNVRNAARQWSLHPVEGIGGYFEHMSRSFAMAARGA